MTGHGTRAVWLPGGRSWRWWWRGLCSGCAWVGPRRDTSWAAVLDGADHQRHELAHEKVHAGESQ